MSKYGVFSGPNAAKYGPEKALYLDTFRAVEDCMKSAKNQLGDKNVYEEFPNSLQWVVNTIVKLFEFLVKLLFEIRNKIFVYFTFSEKLIKDFLMYLVDPQFWALITLKTSLYFLNFIHNHLLKGLYGRYKIQMVSLNSFIFSVKYQIMLYYTLKTWSISILIFHKVSKKGCKMHQKILSLNYVN